MLYDRQYMREPSWGRGMLWTTRLMIVTAVIFFLQAFLEAWGILGVREEFGLSLEGLSQGRVWQLLTFQFLHGGLLHLLLNLVVIYFAGRAIELALGWKRMLKLYLASGVVGGLCQVLFQAVTSFWVPEAARIPVVGASAGAFGLVAAFALLFSEQVVTVLLFLVIPISMKARTLLWISIAMGLFGMLVPLDHVAHAAHLGGILCAVVYVKGVVQGHLRFPNIRLAARRARPPRVAVLSGGGGPPAGASGPGAGPGEVEEDFISRQVDPILDKISAHGIQSLTERERRILEAARNRIQKG